jgi:hypothetical protein
MPPAEHILLLLLTLSAAPSLDLQQHKSGQSRRDYSLAFDVQDFFASLQRAVELWMVLLQLFSRDARIGVVVLLMKGVPVDERV